MKAKLYFLTEQEGGRTITLMPKNPGEKSQYRPTSQKKAHCYWTICINYEQPIEPGKEYELDIAFVANMAYEYFKSGDDLLCYEGKVLVAKGQIL